MEGGKNPYDRNLRAIRIRSLYLHKMYTVYGILLALNVIRNSIDVYENTAQA